VQNKFYILEREQGTGNREQIRNTEIFLFSKNVKLILLRYLEILSPATANTDRVTKKELYQNTFRTPDYFWFDPYTLEFAGFYLTNGQYQSLEPNQKGYLWSEQLGLYLGVHDGLLRYFTSQGELVPTPEETATAADERAAAANERAELEAQRAELEAQRATAADKRAKRLAAKLRELNIDPDKI
jgi:hypothetical protein